ncbi:hypothetical protein Tco_1427694 [Tanacetum coccineum]
MGMRDQESGSEDDKRRKKQRLHHSYREKTTDQKDLSKSGKLCWRKRPSDVNAQPSPALRILSKDFWFNSLGDKIRYLLTISLRVVVDIEKDGSLPSSLPIL